MNLKNIEILEGYFANCDKQNLLILFSLFYVQMTSLHDNSNGQFYQLFDARD